MRFLDELVKAFDDTFVGSLEVMTLVFVTLTIFRGVRVYQKQKRVADKLAHDPKAHVRKPSWLLVISFAIPAVVLTALTIYKHTR